MIRTAVATLLALTACAVAAQAPTTLSDAAIARAHELRERAMAGNRAYGLVESLTTEVGPRMAGTPADALAVDWAKRAFARLGYDRVRLEPVTFPAWRRGHERAWIAAPYPQPLVITTLGGSIGTDGPLEAEVVEFATLRDLQQAQPGAVDGRIAFISNRTERFRDGRGYGAAVVARSQGAIAAAKLGAVAVMIRSIGTSDDRFAHTGVMRYADGVKQIPALALSAPDADQITRALSRGPVRIGIDVDAGAAGEYTSYNVIGEVLGREHPEQAVVIGGHLDSWDLGTGAIDDGAGVGITMAAGALIAAMDERPRRTVRVIAWANEEQGLIGARQYAERHAGDIADHWIGAESDFGAGRIYALRAGVGPQAAGAVERIASALAPLGIAYEAQGGSPGPDIGPLATRGMAWAQLAQDGSEYFDYHHTANDTLDKIAPDALDQQVAAYAVFAYLAAEAEGDFAAPGSGSGGGGGEK